MQKFNAEILQLNKWNWINNKQIIHIIAHYGPEKKYTWTKNL